MPLAVLTALRAYLNLHINPAKRDYSHPHFTSLKRFNSFPKLLDFLVDKLKSKY